MASRLVEKTVGSVHMLGFSMAGEETVIVLPEFNVAFDVGRAPREIIGIDYVLLTHGHMDHAAGIAYYFSQRNFQGAPPGCVVLPKRLAPAIHELLQVWGRIEGHVSPGRIIGVEEDEDTELRKGLVARPFRVRHAAPSLGFSLVEVRKKLKPEYAELSGPQIVELKKRGETVEYRLEIPKAAYCGDSAVGDYLDHDHVRNAEVLLIECTFFEPEHVERARLGQHTHIQDLPELLNRIRSPHIVITHLTRRTGIGEARRYLAKTVRREDLERITFLMEQPRIPRRPPAPSPTEEG